MKATNFSVQAGALVLVVDNFACTMCGYGVNVALTESRRVGNIMMFAKVISMWDN